MLIPVGEGKFVKLTIKKRSPIRDFVQSQGYNFVIGRTFYQHTKSETISSRKKILLWHKVSGQLYEGEAVRQMLGLSKGARDWNIQPSNFDSRVSECYCVYFQSTSVNRALVPSTMLLYQTWRAIKYFWNHCQFWLFFSDDKLTSFKIFTPCTRQVLGSIVVSIPACHAGDRGSIPRRGGQYFFFSFLLWYFIVKSCILSWW